MNDKIKEISDRLKPLSYIKKDITDQDVKELLKAIDSETTTLLFLNKLGELKMLSGIECKSATDELILALLKAKEDLGF